MANYWAQKGWSVTLLSLDAATAQPFFPLDSRVSLVPLGVYRPSANLLAAIWNNLHRIRVLRRAIRESNPDVVISFLFFVNILVLLATRGLGIPVIVSERNYPRLDSIDRIWKALRWLTYSFRVRVVVQTERAQACFSPKLQSRIMVIPNPLPPSATAGNISPHLAPANPFIVAMGSFFRQKGFDLLLRAFAQLKDQHPDWSLAILGGGPLGEELKALRDKLGLNDRAHLLGLVKDPHEVLCQADLFVLSSRWEGWNNSLMEAMACGLPVIAFNCLTSPREIIRDGVDGVLVPCENVDALAEAMARLMGDESERLRLASRAVEVTERFHLNKVMGMWEELLKRVMCD